VCYRLNGSGGGGAGTKAIANGGENFWTQGQVAEMALDSYFQQQRLPLVAWRTARQRSLPGEQRWSVVGWNEETITDDLDLTLRLSDQWDIGFLSFPAVKKM